MADVGASFPTLFAPSPFLSDAINGNIIESEIEGGVRLGDLGEGEVVEIETENRVYTLMSCGDGYGLLRGHPTFCPEPVLVSIHGSTWGGSLLKQQFIGRGMRLEFLHPDYETPIVTSRILEIRTAA